MWPSAQGSAVHGPRFTKQTFKRLPDREIGKTLLDMPTTSLLQQKRMQGRGTQGSTCCMQHLPFPS